MAALLSWTTPRRLLVTMSCSAWFAPLPKVAIVSFSRKAALSACNARVIPPVVVLQMSMPGPRYVRFTNWAINVMLEIMVCYLFWWRIRKKIIDIYIFNFLQARTKQIPSNAVASLPLKLANSAWMRRTVSPAKASAVTSFPPIAPKSPLPVMVPLS